MKRKTLTEMHLYLVDDLHAVFVLHHVDGKSSFTKAPRAADPMQVRLVVSIPLQVRGEVKVDDKCHLLHIDSCRQTGV